MDDDEPNPPGARANSRRETPRPRADPIVAARSGLARRKVLGAAVQRGAEPDGHRRARVCPRCWRRLRPPRPGHRRRAAATAQRRAAAFKPNQNPTQTQTYPERRRGASARSQNSRVASGLDETTQPMDEDEASPAAPRADWNARNALDSAAAPAVATPARALHDGSQFVANMIDDMAAGMMGAGDATLDGSRTMDSTGSGSQTPCRRQRRSPRVARTTCVAHSGRRSRRGGGGSSGVKRRRGGGPNAAGSPGAAAAVCSSRRWTSSRSRWWGCGRCPARGRPSRAVGARGGESGGVGARAVARQARARGGSNRQQAGLQAEVDERAARAERRARVALGLKQPGH